MILSILIPTLPERKRMLHRLMIKIKSQIFLCMMHEIEILTDDSPRPLSTGFKRNLLIEKAKGDYIVFIDDDDDISDDYILSIIQGIKLNPDVITFNGTMTTNGIDETGFEIKLNNPYIDASVNGNLFYLRFPNHLCPMKRDLVKDFKFPNVTMAEDYAWAKQIHDSKILKTEYFINKNMYHYQYSNKK